MYALFAMRKIMLISRISTIQQRLTDLAQQQQDLASYGATMADGIITPDEWAQSPPSMFFAQLALGNQMFGAAAQQATFMHEQMKKTGFMQPVPPIFLMKSILERMGQQQAKRIAVAEQKIAAEKTRIETQLKAAEKELESLEQAEQKAIDRSAPKYA